MSTASDKHSDFHAKLMNLVNEFHVSNPDLFVADIQIHSANYPTGKQVLVGISVRIEVQPCSEKT